MLTVGFPHGRKGWEESWYLPVSIQPPLPIRLRQFCLMTCGLRWAGCGRRPVLRTSNVPCLFFISKGSRRFYELDVLQPGQGGSGRSVTKTIFPIASHIAETRSPATPSPSVAVLTPPPHWILDSIWAQGLSSIRALLSRPRWLDSDHQAEDRGSEEGKSMRLP